MPVCISTTCILPVGRCAHAVHCAVVVFYYLYLCDDDNDKLCMVGPICIVEVHWCVCHV